MLRGVIGDETLRGDAVADGPLEDPPANRVDPARALGLEEGDAHVIRNAGGRTSEAIRSLAISQQLLGTQEVVILHHVRLTPSFFSPPFSKTPIIPSRPSKGTTN